MAPVAWIAVVFAASAAVVVLSGIGLSRCGQEIADRTKLGGLWVGSILLAGATSLPEVVTSLSSGLLNLPDIALGNVFGSNILNLVIIGLLDVVERKTALLSKVSPGHILAATFGMLLSSAAAIFILLDLGARIAWVGFDSVFLVLLYLTGLRVIGRYEHQDQPANPPERAATAGGETGGKAPGLRRVMIRFVVAAAAIVGAGFALSLSAGEIARRTGIGATFIGSVLVSLVTSLPELTAGIAAVRMGAADLAVGNILGSNIFNIFTIVLADLAYRPGPILAAGSSIHALTSLFGLFLSGVVVIGLFYRSKKHFAGLGLDSAVIFGAYILIALVLFARQGL